MTGFGWTDLDTEGYDRIRTDGWIRTQKGVTGFGRTDGRIRTQKGMTGIGRTDGFGHRRVWPDLDAIQYAIQ